MPRAQASRLRWLSIAPFGSPVVPLVKTISARSSGATARRRQRLRRRARSGSVSTRTTGRPERAGGLLGLARGDDERAPPSARRSCARTRPGGGRRAGRRRRRRGRAAKKARPHSGRFTDQMIARSPGARPSSASTRATRGTVVPEIAVAQRARPERRPDQERRSPVEPRADLLHQLDERLHRPDLHGCGGAQCPAWRARVARVSFAPSVRGA